MDLAEDAEFRGGAVIGAQGQFPGAGEGGGIGCVLHPSPFQVGVAAVDDQGQHACDGC